MRTQKNIEWMLAVIMACMATLILLPQIATAGSLEPPPEAMDGSGNPVPTGMLPSSWSQKLQCDATACPRLQIVMDGEAVLDKETGLVWERELSTDIVDWYTATRRCMYRTTGGRQGWKLPTIHELMSVANISTNILTNLFINLQITDLPDIYWYWSSTHRAVSSPGAYSAYSYALSFSWMTSGVEKDNQLNFNIYAWCVRGGQSVDYQ